MNEMFAVLAEPNRFRIVELLLSGPRVVNEIGDEIYAVWRTNANLFCIHPTGAPVPSNQRAFKSMFQFEVNDANTASVVSGALGLPISGLTAGTRTVVGKSVMVNQSQLDKQVPNIRGLTAAIE